ncbi:hypothetical protein [Moumouvirus maliensis]|nr:hypothetical protein [Moumouvirus maliensis]
MQNKSSFKIIPTIEEDAPFGDITALTLSFFSSDRVDKTKCLNIKAFKVHNGYSNVELANEDAKNIKKNKQEHDVYVSLMGKLYPWDDATKSDAIEYDNEKLNELERTRKENIDKIKLMNQQFKNEYKTIYANDNVEKLKAQKKRLREKLYEKGKITKQEYDMLMEEDKTVNEVKDQITEIDKLENEINEANKHDYLDENPSVGLKFGCMSLYSPKNIKNINGLYFKIRGLFQTPEQLNKRVKFLKKMYPHDKIFLFEVGKWSPLKETDINDNVLLKRLNYCMKCYLENLDKEKEEFEKRKQKLQEETETESNLVKLKNRQERRRAKREEAKKARGNKTTQTTDVQSTTSNTSVDKSSEPSTTPKFIGTEQDNVAIQSIYDYLNEPELTERFTYDKSKTQTAHIDVS